LFSSVTTTFNKNHRLKEPDFVTIKMLYSGRLISQLIVLITISGSYVHVNGWSQSSSSSSSAPVQQSRRDVFRSIVQVTAGSMMVAGTTCTLTPSIANAATVPACPRGSKNCIRTTWIVPSGGTKDVAKALGSILASYPQGGQADIDLGGWTNVEGNLVNGDTLVARYEYSSGVGRFAKFFNGGKPFIDDITVEIVESTPITIELRSSSRVGDSDFDVNRLRLEYFGQKAKDLGWTVPDPKY
jgi:Protein of unknown function (DUF1499)